MSLLEKALRLAVEAHWGQKDRARQPYILHPLRVMCRMETEEERIVAVLHDVVEDTRVTLDNLREQGFPESIVQAVDCLTKRQGEPYEAQIERAKANPVARRVKIADLEDNIERSRKRDETERLEKYRGAWANLKPANP
jgi:(p)ppGpp synthase/HD superfamily hydrolase